jgi:hypothetical protein
MAIVKISGGLGNQLFQYAFGKYLSDIYGYDVQYHIVTFANSKSFTNRDLEISNFNVDLPEISDAILLRYSKLPPYMWRLERKLIQLFPCLSDIKIVQKTPHELPPKIRDAYFDGFWQLYQYPEKVRSHLQEKIKLSKEQETKFKDIIKEIQTSASTSIHIRRGDYMNITANKKIFEVCNVSYYQNAIKTIEIQYPNSVFFIFTEDMDWAKKNFIGNKFIFIEGNSAIEDMLLMSLCQNNIIANSTFSWWGAWLNNNPDKIVIAPKQWYVGKLNESTKDLIPKEWIQV